MKRFCFKVSFVVIVLAFVQSATASNCGSNTDWEIWFPMGGEPIDINIGDIESEGWGHANANNCSIRIHMGATLIKKVNFTVDEFNYWSGTLTRATPWPVGAATAKVYCSNGGPPFWIGSGNSFDFVDLLNP